ncbi:cytochrome c family protein [Hyphomonas neptunium ATCC 15444]|uniref:Cytochrome c family protein n=2 Tax=Hyphomonas TaxID=85 RepID=Q0C448_HYPNA|nr:MULTISPECIES: cytochrome c [Hyphomonas]ABI78263.1 cytochrome c family protein [Hyphomonas neptunium ATCC 15444]KCZ96293.1 cytochrome c family protein [Hyphomonas hirschiana VP5]
MRYAPPFMRPILLVSASVLMLAACGREAAAPSNEPAPAPPVEAAEVAPAEPAGPVFDVAALGIPMDEASIADGEAIAQTHCAICHGLGQEGSLRADAPPLRYVLSLYSPENLAEDFRAGIHVGHEDMPGFVFGDLGMDVLLAYLVSIQETPVLEE